ncbi:hypothetical protein [Halomonas campaniensis]|uniref:hypothetical protein n=1 Tax=Halomonas campaniensis TaxID=213554 RepID=UPI0035634C92
MPPLTPLSLVAACSLLLAGCAGLPDGQDVLSTSSEWLSRSGEVISTQGQRLARLAGGPEDEPLDEAEREAEVEALLAQPWIDPLTRFLEAHGDDPRYADQLVTLSRERDRRCAEVAKRYRERPATREHLDRYRRGYLYSCPADVNAFFARVREREASTAMAAPTPPPAESAPAPRVAEEADVEQAVDRRQANDCYLYFTIRNFQQAREACAGPAEQGDARAQHHMGSLEELDGDTASAIRWFRRAADNGDERAATRLEALAEAADGDDLEASP